MNEQVRKELENLAQNECPLCDTGIAHMTVLAIVDPDTGKTSLATHSNGMETILIVGALESAKGYWVEKMNQAARIRDNSSNFEVH